MLLGRANVEALDSMRCKCVELLQSFVCKGLGAVDCEEGMAEVKTYKEADMG